MDCVIRRAQPEDAEQLLAYVQRLLHEPDISIPLLPSEFTLTVEEERRILAEALTATDAVFFVAEVNGEIVGEINCKCGTRQAMRHVAHLGISVSSQWRNRGVGSRLMAEALAWAENNERVTRVELFVFTSNAPAIRLYEKFGFEVEGRRRRVLFVNGQFIDDLIMARLLD